MGKQSTEYQKEVMVSARGVTEAVKSNSTEWLENGNNRV